jgi:hypothetical protein
MSLIALCTAAGLVLHAAVVIVSGVRSLAVWTDERRTDRLAR